MPQGSSHHSQLHLFFLHKDVNCLHKYKKQFLNISGTSSLAISWTKPEIKQN